MIKTIEVILLASLVSASFTLMAADRSPSILPPPVLPASERPADGSGIYRLSLGGALRGSPLIVLVEVIQGKVTGAVALPTHLAPTWAEADVSGLAYSPDGCKGTLKIGFWPLFDGNLNNAEIAGKANPTFTAYEAKPKQFATITLDLTWTGREGKGTWQGVWEGPGVFSWMAPGKGGAVESLWLPAWPDSGKVDLQEADLALMLPLVDVQPNEKHTTPGMWLRLSMAQGKATTVIAWTEDRTVRNGIVHLTVTKHDLSLKDGRISGTVEVAYPDGKNQPFTLSVQGRAIGAQLFGVATFTQGAKTIATPWLGLLHHVPTWHLPLEAPAPGPWTWQHDLPPDAALTAAAQEESLLPVLPGEPGRFEFWTWRSLAKEKHNHGSIHPPSFDVQETPDAVRYRFQLSGVKELKNKRFTFESDKPWRPLTPIWKDVEPGQYLLTVTALDAQDKDMPGPMRHGILDTKSATLAFIETPGIRVIKRPAFSGPYASITVRDWNRTILQAARWVFVPIGHQENRALAPGGAYWTGGEGGAGSWITCNLQSLLAMRALSDSPTEIATTEYFQRFLAEEIQLHQTITPKLSRGVIHMYRGYIPLNQLPGRAILDAWLQTGDARWKEMALTMARGLATVQRSNGAFRSTFNPGDDAPAGFFAGWKVGNPEFGASELLYLFGRIRRDLKTDEFAAVEEKAYRWMMESALPRRFFPLYDTHSQSQGYPVKQHAQSALFFCRYLLELAPPERRDVKLAEELALWAEDHDIIWTRSTGPQTEPIMPRVVRGDRGNDPAHNNMFAAIVFHQLSVATGNPLWAAKADALATAVIQAIDPKTGYFNCNLDPAMAHREFAPYSYHNGAFGSAAAIQILREYAEMKNAAK